MPNSAAPTSTDQQPPDPAVTSFVSTCKAKPLLGIFVALLLLIHGTLVYLTASYCTVTHDEYWHIPVGLLNLQHQRFDFDNLNPPLGRMVAAAPLLAMTSSTTATEPTIKTDLWDYGDEFLAEHGNRYHDLVVAARTPGILLSIVFGLLAAQWATQVFGVRSGIAALVLWVFSPSIISNAALATNDLFVSGLFLLALWRTTKLAITNSRKEVFAVGVAIGAACLVKFTGLLLFAVVPLTMLGVRYGKTERLKLSNVSWKIAAASAVALAVINAGYLFHGSFTPVKHYSFESTACQSIQAALGNVVNLPVPLPKSFMEGIDHQRAMMEGAHPIYLNGEWADSGFLTYFFCVFAWKLPHCLQLLIALSMWNWFRWAKSDSTTRRQTSTKAVLLFPTLLLFAIGSFSDMQLGLRYILPAVPLLIIFASSSIAGEAATRLNFRTIIFWGLVVASLASVRFHPHHLSYFNELAGGPQNGWKLLSDSNIDWGQDLRALKDYLDKNNEVTDLKLAYFGTFPPGELGIQYSLPSEEPQPGWYAVSVNIMQGRPNPIRSSDGSTQTIFGDMLAYLRFFEPVARIGESIRVYYLTEDDLRRRRIELRQVN